MGNYSRYLLRAQFGLETILNAVSSIIFKSNIHVLKDYCPNGTIRGNEWHLMGEAFLQELSFKLDKNRG